MKRAAVVCGIALGIGLPGLFLVARYQPGALAQEKAEAEVGKDKKDKRSITTSGTASVRVAPDAARLHISVVTQSPTLKEARGENSVQVRKVMDALADLRIPDLKMKSVDVQVSPIHEREEHLKVDRLPRVLGYRVTNSFTVLVENKDRAKLGEAAARLLDTALEQGVTNVSRVEFFRKDLESIRREALTRAVEDALANARALAKGIQATIRDTVSVDGTPQFYGGVSLQNAMSPTGGEGRATPLVAGDLEVSCQVSVTCRY
jgi:uncharacterized protein YggE